MNPFEVLGIPESILPDLKQVRQKFLAIQMGEHPDFGSDGDLSEKANKAYSVLKNDIERVRVILSLNGSVNINENVLSPDFLMGMMDISDEIEEGLSGNVELLHSVKQKLEQLLVELKSELHFFHEKAVNNNWLIKDYSPAFLNELIIWFQKVKYLSRLEKNASGVQEL